MNTAVDKLLKKEFDIHRSAQTAHPLMQTYGLDLVPFQHKMMDTWRENFKGVECSHQPTGFTVSGAIDDLWTSERGELHVVDYKATSKDEKITLDAEWQEGYKRQMEVYQWLFRQNGFDVSDIGYFVYVNGRTDREAFDGKLEFDVMIIPYTGSADWIESTLLEIKTCLEADAVPPPHKDCDYCQYRQAAGTTLQAKIGKSAPKAETAKTKKMESHGQKLFD